MIEEGQVEVHPLPRYKPISLMINLLHDRRGQVEVHPLPRYKPISLIINLLHDIRRSYPTQINLMFSKWVLSENPKNRTGDSVSGRISVQSLVVLSISAVRHTAVYALVPYSQRGKNIQVRY